MKYLLYQDKMVIFGDQYVISDSVTPPPSDDIVIGTQTWKMYNVPDNVAGSRVYDGNEANRAIYGGLYTPAMIPSIEALYPGYHVPSNAEISTLSSYLSSQGLFGGALKEVGLTHWQTPNTSATDTYGFKGLPAGYSYGASSYINLGQYAFWLTSTQNTGSTYYYWWLSYNNNNLGLIGNWDINEYASVRLIKN